MRFVCLRVRQLFFACLRASRVLCFTRLGSDISASCTPLHNGHRETPFYFVCPRHRDINVSIASLDALKPSRNLSTRSASSHKGDMPSQHQGFLYWPFEHRLQPLDAGKLACKKATKYVLVIASVFGWCWRVDYNRVCRHRRSMRACSGRRGDVRCVDLRGIASLTMARHLVWSSQLMFGLLPTTCARKHHWTDTPRVLCMSLDLSFVLRLCKWIAVGKTICRRRPQHIVAMLGSTRQWLQLHTCFCLRLYDLWVLPRARKPSDAAQDTDLEATSVLLWDVVFIMSIQQNAGNITAVTLMTQL